MSTVVYGGDLTCRHPSRMGMTGPGWVLCIFLIFVVKWILLSEEQCYGLIKLFPKGFSDFAVDAQIVGHIKGFVAFE